MRRGGGVSPVKKSGALAGRLGVRPGDEIWEDPVLDKCLLAGSAGTVGDARSKIGGGGGKISDARFGGILLFQDENTFFRDVLAAKGKGLDARQKLEKMRNLKVKIQTCQARMLAAVCSFKQCVFLGWQPGGEEGWRNHSDKEGGKADQPS